METLVVTATTMRRGAVLMMVTTRPTLLGSLADLTAEDFGCGLQETLRKVMGDR